VTAVDCDHHVVLRKLQVDLVGCLAADRIKVAKAWIAKVVVDCPQSEEFWYLTFNLVTGQIEAGRHEVLIIREDTMSEKHDPTHLRIVNIFGALAALSIVGGIVAVIWNAVAPTEFSLWGAKLSTGSVGVAFVGLGLVSAVVAVRSLLKHKTEIERIRQGGKDKK